MKTIFKDVLLTALALLITGSLVHAQAIETAVEPANDVTAVTQTAPVEIKTEPVKNEKPAPVKEVTWQDNPNKCDQNTHYIAKEAPFKCIEKPKATAAATPVRGGVSGGGSGDCAAEIAKYDWNQSVALAVARAESGLDPGNLNDNPSTGDYSIGCFQVNIYGANARNRPSEAELKNAAINVKWSYNNYLANGSSFIGQWGVCRSKVSCY